MLSSHSLDAVLDTARRLSPTPVRRVAELRRGQNNRIFRVEAEGGDYALKRYPAEDKRDRMRAELAALAFFARRGIGRTPRLVALEPETRHVLLSWMEGEPIAQVSEADVAAFADFQIELDAAIDARARREIGEASEACLSGRRILGQIGGRFRRLAAVKAEMPQFAAFYDGMLVPALEALEAQARRDCARIGLDFDADLPAARRTLIPSDFGAHNALRRADGSLEFLDFEYFGWDDPATSIALFVMHPAMRLSASQKLSYRQRMIEHFPGTCEAERLAALMPLYALRWCGIILNELLPERWRHRLVSRAELGGWDEVRQAQIEKARRLLEEFWSPC
ncbi:MAG: phosphotransferase [Alphaproteobacteria bacterium]